MGAKITCVKVLLSFRGGGGGVDDECGPFRGGYIKTEIGEGG